MATILHCRVSTALPCVFFVAHGKHALCRVPEIVHTAKILAHGKLRVSGSASSPQPLLEQLLTIGHGGQSTVDTGTAEDLDGSLPWPSPGAQTVSVSSDDEIWATWPNV